MIHEKEDLSELRLNGARGITYLMFLRKAETSDVVKLLSNQWPSPIDQSIVHDRDSVYQYISKFEEEELLQTVYVLPEPGPPKIREVAVLDPIFDTVSSFRSWKLTPKDERQLTNLEKQQLKLLFQSIGCFLDYFPQYFLWGVKALRKTIKGGIEWYDTLGIFFQFCERLIEVCWEIMYYNIKLDQNYLNKYSIIEEGIHPYFLALQHLIKDPHRYVCEAYKKQKITDQDILTLANFSEHGHKDIYLKGTLLQELYLISTAFRDPLSASHFFRNIEEIEAKLWEDKLREINVRALDMAISEKARQEEKRISDILTKMIEEGRRVKDMAKRIAMHEAREQFRRETNSYEENDVNQALRTIIKIAKLDITEQELKKLLVDLEVCEFLDSLRHDRCRDFYLKLKDEGFFKIKSKA